MARISEQVEWFNLIDRSGPFLVPAILEEVFPQGLEKIETPRRQRLRAAYDEWRDAVDEDDPELNELHAIWTRMVIQEALEYEDEVLIPRERLGDGPIYRAREHSVEVAPDFAVRGDDGKPRLLIAIHPPETDLEKPLRGDRWTASPAERMTLLCRTSKVRIGLVTNGEEWMLVNAPIGSTSGYASWFARLWWLEPVTLKAFVSLLGVRRCFGPSEETLDQLLERSIAFQEEVTDTLGEQVRRAVEVLIRALGHADQDRNGELLKDVRPAELYEAGLTVMMRLVFILCAEERGLLLLGDPVYDQHHAISTLRAGLREDESQHGPEVLERRHDAWSRMLAVFRAVYGGVEHETLRMPALGGSLFDPDRFPFLEGRAKGTSWREEPAFPLPIDNRTVLLLLTALQILEQRGGAQFLSYRSLDIEQIGHVYEGLLEYTVAKLSEVTVGLIGSQNVRHPNIGLDELESLHAKGVKAAAKHLADLTGRSATAINNSLERGGDDAALIKLIQACGGDETLASRLLPFTELIRTDSWGSLLVYQAGSFAVTHGADRRETGTHYTPRSLTESIVEKTLEPVVYVGPAEGKPREEWRLRSPAELLDLRICDPAMGSGAFLVQVTRYLAERLVEAWAQEEDAGRVVTVDGVIRDRVRDEEPLPKSLDDRLLIARRLVAERCPYGVDLNPLAVELAKLSIWLVTLAKGRPFGFLDHNLRCGDSLLGIHRLEQLTKLKLYPDDGPSQQRIFGQNIKAAVDEAIKLRKQLREVPIRDIRDVEAMAHLDEESRKVLEGPSLVADAFIGEVFRSNGKRNALENAADSLAMEADRFLSGDEDTGKELQHTAREALSADLPAGRLVRRPFHWPLEFPEVFGRAIAGFDAFVGNPPMLGGKRISYRHSTSLLAYLKSWLLGPAGTTDLCVYFLLRASRLIGNGGFIGFVLSDIVAQGESRVNGLSRLLDEGFVIYNCIPSVKWPGRASVKIAHVHITSSTWNAPYVVGKQIADGRINSYLQASEDQVTLSPQKLAENNGLCYSGHYLMSQGFVISPEEADRLCRLRSSNSKVIFPLIRGDDINNTPKQTSGRFAINFSMRSLEVCEREFPECLELVRRTVKPERDLVKRKSNHERWWRYARARPGLEKAISNLDKVIVQPFTAKYIFPTFVDAHSVFAHPLVVIVRPTYFVYACLQSSVHELWVWQFCSTSLDLLRYTASTVLTTFPFPSPTDAIEEIGRVYYAYRQRLIAEKSSGLTDIYNEFHDANVSSPEIERLRDLHAKLNVSILHAYGWQDIDSRHGFCEVARLPQGRNTRCTINDNARAEILHRLAVLNRERHEEESP